MSGRPLGANNALGAEVKGVSPGGPSELMMHSELRSKEVSLEGHSEQMRHSMPRSKGHSLGGLSGLIHSMLRPGGSRRGDSHYRGSRRGDFRYRTLAEGAAKALAAS